MEFDLSPPKFTFYGEDGKRLVTLHPDGRVELGEGASLDEATQTFWSAVEQNGFERLVPSGYALVPTEPTDDMIEAPMAHRDLWGTTARETARYFYEAMVAARPNVPSKTDDTR